MEKILSRTPATVPEQLYAELTAEVADLAEIFSRAILNVEINSVIEHIAEVDRTAELLRASIGCRNDLAKGEMPIDQPKDARQVENYNATRILELYDRLGGFIKP